ncbi:hypothetical protein [Ramlibacter albus]|uniref:Uncharacterized protein n=1 Tax=Ramlibacter albus TaxID=2079448 RepID=A0A923S1M9_9BURK|nr:hypothetical protein [Ramlibacter albus]MBC5764599.1 hypothetical protein [Ramlibacter albus]
MSGWHVVGWKLDRAQRDELLGRFRPKYDNAVADHVTLKAGVDSKTPKPGAKQGEIVGRADDGKGVEAMVVRIDGSTDRPGGGTYHITWSLAEGRKAKESNDVIAARGWEAIDPPVPVQLEGAMF